MGEIAEMMIGGMLCECCGKFIGDECGYPRRCAGCSEDIEPEKSNKVRCPICKKKVKAIGLQQHARDKHGEDLAMTMPPKLGEL